METGCQEGQGSPRAVAPGGWMDGWMDGCSLVPIHKKGTRESEDYTVFNGKIHSTGVCRM